MDYHEYQGENSLGAKLSNAARLMTNRLNQRFREHDYPVTVDQWLILMQLWAHDGQTQNALACATHKDQPSISRLVDNMIKRNLVHRVLHPDDRRANLIYLTAAGRDMQKGLISQAMQNIQEASRSIDPPEMEVFLRVLDQIVKNLESS
ncbi:MarR family winged helix-turn-helix transcriptional regulator [Tumebacillus permanentifrigoris]|uniref:DNA-binding MarR family transcriptional regulator n=1 Tax=Tumebacillus permanentifrigoris TaxID=378543 RepID=A0A316DIM5_9BACL|nr:MarR family transcriptional regulator [Tumebacillus permanentifrigoris]PWK16483.1 DNA-binding MarR family transcriptional regulator [Tumebacillus permanentifrigoris]